MDRLLPRPAADITYRPRILALHGAQSNNNVTKLQLENLWITESWANIELNYFGQT